MRRTLVGLITVLLLVVCGSNAEAESIARVTVTRGGTPAPNVPLDMEVLNRGKVPLGTTGANGDLEIALGMANLGKATRVQVVIYDCPNDRNMVLLVEAGADAPEDKDCRRRIAGWFWFGRARTVTIDLTAATLQVQGQSFLGTTTGRLVLVGAAGAAGIGIAAGSGGGGTSPGTTPTTTPPPAGGGTTFDPTGNYGVTSSVASDPGEHRGPINLEPSTVLAVTITGTTVRIVCPPGSRWTLLTGTFNPSTGQVTAEGRGVAAGISNVLFRFNATIAMSGTTQGNISGQLTIGAGSELPGGLPIVYNVSGRKQ